MLPEERAREKIDKQLINAGWDIVSRNEYIPKSTSAVKEGLMQGNTESDYLLFVDDKAIAVVEAKREDNPLGPEVEKQAEGYAKSPQNWYGLWYQGLIPLVYMANGKKIYFKNMLTDPDGDYVELSEMHSPKKMLSLINKVSEYGALPRLEKKGLRDCQYNAEIELEKSMKEGKKKNLAILATGSGKTYLACLASYRLLNYTPTKRILFLVDRNNLARQTEAEFSQFDRTEGQVEMSSLYEIKRLKKENDIKADIVISTIQKLFAVLTGQALSDDSEDAEDEKTMTDEEKESKEVITLGDDLKLPPDHFQFIIVDAYGIIGLNSKDSTDKGFLKLSPILFSPQKRLMVDLRRKHAQNEDLSAKRSAACNSGSTVSDVVPSRLLQRQSAEHTPDVDLHRSTVRYPKDVSLACAA